MTFSIISKTVLLLAIMLASGSAGALELVSPAQYTEVHPGDTVVIVVKPSPGELIGKVIFNLSGEVDSPPYEYRYTVASNELGNIKKIIAAAKADSLGPFPTSADTFSSRVDLYLKSTLSSNVKIQSLRATFIRDEITFYLKQDNATGNYLPRTERLRVYAMYSDGVERDVSSASAGTTYTSSGASVLTISADGFMTALKPGNVKITAANGDKKIDRNAIISKF